MPTLKDLIKDTIALGGHYCNYSAAYIVVAKYMVVVSCYLYIASQFDEAAIVYFPYAIIGTSFLLVCSSLKSDSGLSLPLPLLYGYNSINLSVTTLDFFYPMC